MALPHKDIVFPEVDLSGDDGAPEWAGEEWVPIENGHTKWVCPPGHIAKCWGYKQEAWEEAVGAYESAPDRFSTSWRYLDGHPIYWRFHQLKSQPEKSTVGMETEYGFGSDGISVYVHTVCPDCGQRHEEELLNSKTVICLETGKWEMLPADPVRDMHNHWHDYDLDTHAPTYEQAVIELARKVWEKYGNDRRIADAPEVQLDR